MSVTDPWSTDPHQAVPVLPVADVLRSTAWYQRLGFTLRASYDGYAILGFGGAEVHLAEDGDPLPAGQSRSGAYLRVPDADAVFERWHALGAPTVGALTDQPWGQREFATEDLDGNLWRIGSPLGAVAGDPVPPPGSPADASAGAAADSPADPPAGTPDNGSEGTGLDAWFALVADGRTCAGCGLDIADTPSRALGATVRDEAHALGRLLTEADDGAVRTRPAPMTWSALEYGVHVRDLLRVFAERIVLTLRQDDPTLGWWDHEEAIEDGLANESDTSAVADDLGRNAATLSEALRLVTDEDWERPATRRDGERFTIDLLGRFALHETVHHLADARRSLAAVGRPPQEPAR